MQLSFGKSSAEVSACQQTAFLAMLSIQLMLLAGRYSVFRICRLCGKMGRSSVSNDNFLTLQLNTCIFISLNAVEDHIIYTFLYVCMLFHKKFCLANNIIFVSLINMFKVRSCQKVMTE